MTTGRVPSMGCVGIKRTEDEAVNEWKGQGGALFAKWISCMGLTQREIDEDRYNECPCLLVTVKKRDPMQLLTSITNIIQKVAENKLEELLAILAAEAGADASGGSGSGMDLDFSWFGSGKKKDSGTGSAAGYDAMAEFRARLKALKAWLRTNRGILEPFDIGLRELPLGADAAGAFEMNGPVYVFLQNVAGGAIVARVLFPSMTKQGAAFLNYDNLAKAHRWVERLINSVLYTGQADCNAPCNNGKVVYTKYKYNWRKARCMRKMYYMPCGDQNLPKPKKRNANTKIWNSAIYEVNLGYPPIAKYFVKSRIRAPVYSILPSDWDLYAGARYMLMSENRKWFMMLNGNTFGVYENKKNQDLVAYSRGAKIKNFGGVYKYGIKFDGTGVRVALEAGVLTIYGKPAPKKGAKGGEDNEILWRLELAKGGVEPLSLYLHDNGLLSLLDGDNKNVLETSALEAALDRADAGKEVLLEGYDPAEEYKRRLMQLMDWLRARGIVEALLPSLPSAAANLMVEMELGPDTAFDESVNYRARLSELMDLLRSRYPTISLPSDDEVRRLFTTVRSYQPDADAAVGTYDPATVLAARLREVSV